MIEAVRCMRISEVLLANVRAIFFNSEYIEGARLMLEIVHRLDEEIAQIERTLERR